MTEDLLSSIVELGSGGKHLLGLMEHSFSNLVVVIHKWKQVDICSAFSADVVVALVKKGGFGWMNLKWRFGNIEGEHFTTDILFCTI